MSHRLSKIKIVLLMSFAIVALGIGLFVYNESTKKVVSSADIYDIGFQPPDTLQKNTVLSGMVVLKQMETIAFSTPIRVNNVVYITTFKKMSFSQSNSFQVTFDHIDNLAAIEKIVLIGGDFYSGRGIEKGISAKDFEKIEDQKIIWERSQ